MERLAFNKLEEILLGLEGGKVLIDIPPEISKELIYLQFKQESYENLFRTALISESDIVNDFILKDFLETYSNTTIEYKTLVNSTLINLTGPDGYGLICSLRLRWNFNLQLNILEIFK